jgi:anti-sigma regulatory factor (Ser/Thr protein kinase)
MREPVDTLSERSGRDGPIASRSVVTLDLPPDPRSVTRARELVRAHVGPLAPTEAAEVAALLVTELVTNAVLHARTTIALAVDVEPGRIRLRVADESDAVPTRRNYAPEVATGRGLALVDQLATAWGVDPSSGGKEVWAEIAFTPVASDGSGAREARA